MTTDLQEKPVEEMDPLDLALYSFGEDAPDHVRASLTPGVIAHIDPSYLSVQRGFNNRNFDSPSNIAHVEALAENIVANGVKESLTARIVGTRIVIRSGESRLRAALRIREKQGQAAITSVPVVLAPELNSAEELADQEIRNTGKRFAMLEQLNLVNGLKSEGWTSKEMTTHLGFSRMHLSNLGVLDRATPTIKDLVAKENVSASLVIDELREAKTEDEIKAVEKKLVRSVEREKAKASGEAKVTKAKTMTPEEKAKKPIFNRGTFDALGTAAQDVLAILPAPKDVQNLTPDDVKKLRSKIHRVLSTALSNANLPLKREAAKDEPAKDEPQTQVEA